MLAAALAVGGAEAGALTRRRQLCARYFCTTVARDRLVSVLRVRARPMSGPEEEEPVTSLHWALRRRTGQVWELRDPPPSLGASDTLHRLALAGSWVAFADSGCEGRSGNGCFEGVQRLDVASGKFEYDLGHPFEGPKVCEPIHSGSAFTPEVSVLRLAGSGTIAWMQSDEVCELSHGPGEPVLLGQGASLDPISLEFADGFVIWRQGDALESAPLS